MEALGTDVWAAPRGTPEGEGSPTGATEQEPTSNPGPNSPSRGTVPLVTVETVCVVDLRENKPSGGGGAVGSAALAAAMEDPAAPLPPGAVPRSAGGVGGGGRAPVFATSVLPGEFSASVGSFGGTGARGKSDKAAAKIKREAAVRRAAQRRARDREERR